MRNIHVNIFKCHLHVFKDMQNKIVEPLSESHVFVGQESIVWNVGIILMSTDYRRGKRWIAVTSNA